MKAKEEGGAGKDEGAGGGGGRAGGRELVVEDRSYLCNFWHLKALRY